VRVLPERPRCGARRRGAAGSALKTTTTCAGGAVDLGPRLDAREGVAVQAVELAEQALRVATSSPR
jgi:hypothetical protein